LAPCGRPSGFGRDWRLDDQRCVFGKHIQDVVQRDDALAQVQTCAPRLRRQIGRRGRPSNRVAELGIGETVSGHAGQLGRLRAGAKQVQHVHDQPGIRPRPKPRAPPVMIAVWPVKAVKLLEFAIEFVPLVESRY
jgi:hypothetical protein